MSAQSGGGMGEEGRSGREPVEDWATRWLNGDGLEDDDIPIVMGLLAEIRALRARLRDEDTQHEGFRVARVVAPLPMKPPTRSDPPTGSE